MKKLVSIYCVLIVVNLMSCGGREWIPGHDGRIQSDLSSMDIL